MNYNIFNRLIFIIILINITVFCGCNTEKDKDYVRIKQENKELKKQIKEMKDEEGAYSFQAIVMPKSQKVKLGDDYIANVKLAVVDTNHPPITILCNVDTLNGNEPKLIQLLDTLKYSKYYQTSMYRKQTTTKGKKQWAGMIIQYKNGKKYQYPFIVQYEVY